jgi:hypothetical protein
MYPNARPILDNLRFSSKRHAIVTFFIFRVSYEAVAASALERN